MSMDIHCITCAYALIDQLTCMLPTGRDATSSGASADDTNGSAASPSSRSMRAVPSDQEICHVLRQVQLGPLLDRVSGDAGVGLDTSADWASMLSLGEQQRLAFARYCNCRVHVSPD